MIMAKNKVKQHSADHHQRALPCRLGAELPRFRVMPEHFRIHGLIDHAVYLAIPADRKPSDTIFSINVFHLGKEPRKPFGLLRAEEFHIPRIEEKEKFVDLDAEKAGKDEMPEFMYDNQYRKGNDYLKYFY